MVQHEQPLTVDLMLAYPTGRSRVCKLETHTPLRVGSEFDLYGRHWRVARLIPADYWNPETRWLCTSVGPGPFD